MMFGSTILSQIQYKTIRRFDLELMTFILKWYDNKSLKEVCLIKIQIMCLLIKLVL